MKRNLLIFIITVFLASCANGNAIISGNPRPPIPVEQVKVYFDPPSKFETIGIVTASGTGMVTGYQANLGVAMAEIKLQASKIGANGVLLNSSDIVEISSITRNAANVTAKAIFVPN